MKLWAFASLTDIFRSALIWRLENILPTKPYTIIRLSNWTTMLVQMANRVDPSSSVCLRSTSSMEIQIETRRNVQSRRCVDLSEFWCSKKLTVLMLIFIWFQGNYTVSSQINDAFLPPVMRFLYPDGIVAYCVKFLFLGKTKESKTMMNFLSYEFTGIYSK